ncbi:hypothetical protein H5T58_02485 [Candidatus Parcubacteria bacterium]|nr:hypothetical protein [Candidatus Parcubacteria bacterium]
MKEIMSKFSQKILDFLLHPELLPGYKTIKIIFIFFGILFSIFTFWGLFFTSWAKLAFWDDLIEFFTFKSVEKKNILKKWQKIKQRFLGGIEAEIKLAILEAVEFLEEVLKNQGYSGKLEEQIQLIPPEEVSNLTKIKELINLKENILADPSFHLKENPTEIVRSIEEFLKDLQVL